MESPFLIYLFSDHHSYLVNMVDISENEFFEGIDKAKKMEVIWAKHDKIMADITLDEFWRGMDNFHIWSKHDQIMSNVLKVSVRPKQSAKRIIVFFRQ